ncbi:MAG: malonyl CoA-acyl carrier protein transacylase, partial [Ectothiorhodospiraceae bacterium]|nr:malonyl CoA-acyl carrier protein transacylase [Ectothiorhodospiraceae bacterium]
KGMLLPVSVPSHCALMKGASEELAKALDDVNFGNALTPVVQNVTAEVVQDAEALKQNLVQQLYSPVRWTDSLTLLSEEGVGVAVECGSGKVLAGLAKRVDRNMNVVSIETPEGLAAALSAFSQG